MVFFWFGAIVVFAILEMASTQLISIWLAFGAIGALIAQMLGATVLVQWIVFVILSALLLVCTRPLTTKLLVKKITRTNSDKLIGKEAVVTEEIVNLQAKGAVKIDGKTWTARSVKEDTVISQGSIVLVREIEGVKLLVELPSEAEQEGTAEGPAPSEQ